MPKLTSLNSRNGSNQYLQRPDLLCHTQGQRHSRIQMSTGNGSSHINENDQTKAVSYGAGPWETPEELEKRRRGLRRRRLIMM